MNKDTRLTAPDADRALPPRPAPADGRADGLAADVSPADAGPAEAGPVPPRPLTPAARRALEEAEARRAAIDARARDLAARPEVDGRGGKEPVRFGDWEVKGIATDF